MLGQLMLKMVQVFTGKRLLYYMSF